MRTSRLIVALTIAAVTAIASAAADPYVLSPAAKRLSKAEIIAAYGGRTVSWSHPNTDKGTGTFVADPQVTAMTGTYNIGGKTGEWEGKISWHGDEYCARRRSKGGKTYNPQTCSLVFADQGAYVELDPRTKKITSVNHVIK